MAVAETTPAEYFEMKVRPLLAKNCFSCHTAHALNPHAMGPATTAAAVLGADKLAPMVTVEGKMPPPAPRVRDDHE